MSEKFFQRINYSSSTEDSEAELRALRLSDSDSVVCITGSGARSLDLLTATPARIVSVDFSAAQNHLLQLKIAGYRHLDYQDFLHFTGCHLSPRTEQLADQMLSYLPADSREFWKQNRPALKGGLLYCGTWEKLLRQMSRTTCLRQRHVDGLLNAADLNEQRDYWRQHWTGSFFRNFLRILSNRFLWTRIIREPGARLIPREFNVADYLYSCLQLMANHSLLRENPYANLIFCGRYTTHCRLPIHLQEDNFEHIRDNLDRIHIHTAPIDTFLLSQERCFDAFSLSDFASYATPEAYQNIWRAVAGAAKPGARFCERFFLVKYEQMNALKVRDSELEEQLRRMDHTCLYTFHAGALAGAIGEDRNEQQRNERQRDEQ
ncbi:MAG: DUF3419 family protein [Planctomycetaceae bacterium]|nr:DUF3419 family protein [Planctomycetaceae bacterium]